MTSNTKTMEGIEWLLSHVVSVSIYRSMTSSGLLLDGTYDGEQVAICTVPSDSPLYPFLIAYLNEHWDHYQENHYDRYMNPINQ